MDVNFFKEITDAYNIETKRYTCEIYGSGLVNTTYLLHDLLGRNNFVLQKINQSVFKNPNAIAENQNLAYDYLKKNYADYFFLYHIKTKNNEAVYFDKHQRAWRLFPFVKHSVAYDFLGTPEQAFSAAQQFGRLTKYLDGVDVMKFNIIIEKFHDLEFRFENFKLSIETATSERLAKAKDLIAFYLNHQSLVEQYKSIINNPEIKTRITHNDTKINNVLFDERNNKAICVIDLDTLMPGKFMYDLGDMIRTFVSPSAEDETDRKQVYVREEIYDKIFDGYMGEMAGALTRDELNVSFFAGLMMPFMMGLRFLTDYLQNDVYYKILRSEHNLDRTMNQRYLIEDMELKEPFLRNIIRKYI